MQLILSIDDIGIKNMSSDEETNQSEKINKTEIKDSKLTSSPPPSNITEEDPEKHDQIVESCESNITDETNGTASCDDASLNLENCNKSSDSCELENHKSLTPENKEEGLDTHKIKTETEDNVLSDECQEKELSVNKIIDDNCDENVDSDINLSVKTEVLNEEECQDENVTNINENEDTSNLKDDKVKQESCDYEEDNISASDVLKTHKEELSQHQHNDEDAKQYKHIEENGVDDDVEDTSDENKVKPQINDHTDVIDNLITDNVENCKIEDGKTSQHISEKTIQENSTCSINDEVIDIADERDGSDIIENEDQDSKVEEKLTHVNEVNTENDCVVDDPHKEKGPITIDEDIIDIADEKDSCDSIADTNDQEYNILRNKLESGRSENTLSIKNSAGDIDVPNTVSETRDCNKTSNVVESSDFKLKKSESTDKVTSYKLSNTLDILSDEEDESDISKPVSPKPKQESESNDKQCINIVEDDDVMVIDDETSSKDEKITTEDKKAYVEVTNKKDTLFKTQQTANKDLEEPKKGNDLKTELSLSEVTKTSIPRSPLLSSTLKSFKKNFAEMTREELEDFCILTIAEAVFDRSNLGELKSQMKILSQNFEEHKLKAKNLAKQNRDLQVVLKSIQEEQKKNSDAPITPLKITRSVGMQVLMTDKVSRKRQAMLSAQNMLQSSTPTKQITPTPNKVQNKPTTSPNVSNTKTPQRQTQQQIPVPRLVPAVNPVIKPNSSPQVNNVKSPVNIPNGVKTTPPATKPEKRTHTKMQQSGAVTVDLTDDEPPAKVVTRNFNSPVRCVPPQSLLAPRPSLPMTSPRKVYIPISGQQAQNIRPGQHIMLKSVTGIPGVGPGRPRGPSPNMKIAPNNSGQLRPRIAHRHPAPLPELMKQYQPPNWKALPPAPELKLAKVENGIVISWKIDGYREDNHEEIASYQLFAYQETSQPPNTALWKKIGDVKALPLPMACTLTQFMSGYKYYFAVRAVDVKSRFGPFSLPGSILLLKN